MIKPEVINEIRGKSDIVEIVGEYLPLIKKGKNYFGVCPFHDDTNPSMSVSKDKQIYTCFSCGATGNVINFIMDYDKITYLEALKILADKAAIDINISGYMPVKKDDDDYKVYEIVNMFYQNNLNTSFGKTAIEYLNSRKIDEKIIKEFDIGLALKDRDKVAKFLISKNFNEKKLIDLGLINRGEYGIYDIFVNRIMFPLYNETGKIIGYSGRIYDDSSENKYVNTRETEIFKKGLQLYNYHRAKESVRESKSIIIMEGFMDVIRAYSVGIKNVVAAMGTAFTKEQAMLIKKLSKDIYLCFDGDEAGFKATIAASNELMRLDIVPKIIKLNNGDDPDSYILKNGKEQFVSLIDNAISLIDFKIDYYKRGLNLNNSSDLTNYVKVLMKDLNLISDPIMFEITLKKISMLVDVSYDTLLGVVKREIKEAKVTKEVKIKKLSLNKYEKAEKIVLYYMLKDENVIIMYRNRMPYLPTLNCRFLLQEIIDFYEKYKTINVSDFISFLGDKKELINEVGHIEAINYDDEYSIDQLEDFMKVLNEFPIKKEIERLKELMKLEINPLEKAKIGQKITDLKMRSEVND